MPYDVNRKHGIYWGIYVWSRTCRPFIARTCIVLNAENSAVDREPVRLQCTAFQAVQSLLRVSFAHAETHLLRCVTSQSIMHCQDDSEKRALCLIALFARTRSCVLFVLGVLREFYISSYVKVSRTDCVCSVILLVVDLVRIEDLNYSTGKISRQ